jgi:2-octaprenyl-6-methoxyphenol hydroxylase
LAAIESPEVDVAIAGGGPVGCALALALSGSAISVARIAGEADFADRPIALSYGSRLILERLGAWNSVRANPIETIHVSQQGFGRTIMRCADYGLPALGYVTAYSELAAQLAGRTPVSAESLRDWKSNDNEVVLQLSRGEKEAGMRARLLVLADGGQSRHARHVRDYRQQAIVAEVTAEHPRGGVAWERFTAEGPLALLPFEDRYALVWSVRPGSAAELLGFSDSDFLARLREIFGGRLGNFGSVGPRSTFPLSLRHGRIVPAARVLAIGNAAQTLHPVAGQGLNLGLRDAWELAQMLLDAAKEEIGASRFLARYARGRSFDRYAGIGFTDFLVRIFSNSLAPLALARGAGLTALDALPPARRFLARRMIFGARALP